MFLSDKIVLLSRRPGSIKKIFEIELEHPRDREDEEFKDLVSEITRAIDELEDD
ncbi:MAG: hypothetical protein U0K80_05720 [Methanobrevibacter sp.]|nr:hypothetical protein [Methanobrevibacter sp.]